MQGLQVCGKRYPDGRGAHLRYGMEKPPRPIVGLGNKQLLLGWDSFSATYKTSRYPPRPRTSTPTSQPSERTRKAPYDRQHAGYQYIKHPPYTWQMSNQAEITLTGHLEGT